MFTFVFLESLTMHFTPNFSGTSHSVHFICFFRYSTHSTFSSWAASSCGVLMIIMLTPLVYSSSQSYPSVFHFMRPVRSVSLTCVYCFPLDMENIINPFLFDLLFCSKASLFTKWLTLSQMSQCWDSQRVSFYFVWSWIICFVLKLNFKFKRHYGNYNLMFCSWVIWSNTMSLGCWIWIV